MTKEELKAALCAAIEKRLDDIRAIGMSIAEEPELGYKEVKTSAKVQEAFDRYLGAKGAAYVEAKRVTPLAAVRLVREFGGVPVLAHPKKYLYDKTLNSLVEGLKPHGLAGLEAYYPGHTEADIAALLQIARKYGLIATGGSDYHGDEEKNFLFEPSLQTLRALGVRR